VLPFSAEQFFAVFDGYNRATWPAPVLAYLAAFGMVAAALLGRAAPAVAAGLAVLWIWTGLAYHVAHFAAINPAAWGFGAAFAVQGVLLLRAGLRGRLAFGPPRRRIETLAGLALVAYAAVLYPLLTHLSGHAWPAAPVFGVTPCPLTIFTFGILLLTRGRLPLMLLVIPALWSLVGGTAAVLLGVLPDWMLPISALVGTALLRARRDHRAQNGIEISLPS
jgi:hypothetical protein